MTPAVFWRHHQELIDAEGEELPGLIQNFMNLEKDGGKLEQCVLITPTRTVYLGTLAALIRAQDFDLIIVCSDIRPDIVEAGDEQMKGKLLHLKCGSGKLGSRALRAKLPAVSAFVSELTSGFDSPKILFACPTSNDLAVGVALAVLCLFFDDDCR